MIDRMRPLPLGIDIGTRRVRVAYAERSRASETQVQGVISRDLPSDAVSLSGEIMLPELVGAAIEQAVDDIGARERRCIASVRDDALRFMRLPDMSNGERVRAMRYEAERFAGWRFDEDPTVVRAHRVSDELYAVGAVRRRVLDSRVRALRIAGLSPKAIESETFALHRVAAQADAVIDIGCERTRVHIRVVEGQCAFSIPVGGAHVTRGIAADLGIDEHAAEARKRIVGLAGAGVAERDRFLMLLAGTFERLRARLPLSSVALTGNGSRLAGLPAGIGAAIGCTVEMPVPETLRGDAYPDDVLEVAAPDWGLAVGLALWSAA